MTSSNSSTRSAAAALAAALLTLPALTGCQGASAEGRLAILEEDPADPVPGYVDALGILAPGSARFLGAADGMEYYVGEQAATRGIVCLVPVNAEDPEAEGAVACSTESDNVVLMTKDVHGEAALVADGADDQTLDRLAEDGWTEVSQNLWVR
ncbi:hypothetical protein F7P69_22105 [Cellulosimicrobium funkei]|nr:hypothetical protein [Cellulosimicrobium funkei]